MSQISGQKGFVFAQDVNQFQEPYRFVRKPTLLHKAWPFKPTMTVKFDRNQLFL